MGGIQPIFSVFKMLALEIQAPSAQMQLLNSITTRWVKIMKNLMIIGGVIVVAAGGYLVWSLSQEKGSMAEAPKMETTTTPEVVVIDPAEENAALDVESDVAPETVDEQVEAVQDAAETAVQDIQDSAAEQVEAVEETATDAVNEIVNDTAEVVNDAAQVTDTAVETMTDAANEAAESANDAVTSAMEKINDAASSADTSVSSETAVEGSVENPKPATE